MLEYCAGGDLAAYIQLYGKVSEVVARHFMRQLGMSLLAFAYFVANSLANLCLNHVLLVFPGAGLQVLRNNNLIHRDLKPQVCRN